MNTPIRWGDYGPVIQHHHSQSRIRDLDIDYTDYTEWTMEFAFSSEHNIELMTIRALIVTVLDVRFLIEF